LKQLLEQGEELLSRVGVAFVEGVQDEEDGLEGRGDDVGQQAAQLGV
jgi:hypothetical protein